MTRLHRPTVIDCTWIETLVPAAVEDLGGFVPNAKLVEILKKTQPHLPTA
jgi:hypothetical protein